METKYSTIQYLTDMLNAHLKSLEFYQKKVDEIRKLIKEYEKE